MAGAYNFEIKVCCVVKQQRQTRASVRHDEWCVFGQDDDHRRPPPRRCHERDGWIRRRILLVVVAAAAVVVVVVPRPKIKTTFGRDLL